MKPTPILFLGDSPELPTGLARIARDLATHVSRLPEFRVGYLGRGGNGSRHLPFVQYNFDELRQWGEDVIQQAWMDFSPRERGIVFTIWDPSRLLWFGRAQYLPSGPLKNFLVAGHFDKWGYFPIDSVGPSGRLSVMAAETLLGYDRLLVYTQWADSVVRQTIADAELKRRGLDWIPHGMNLKVFTPQDRKECRASLFPVIHDNDTFIGVVGTNQGRKDWGLMAEVCRLLVDKLGRKLRFWWHIDVLERHWSIPALLRDFGLGAITVVTHEFTEQEMATAYSACDLTLHPGLGEGFGFPIAESLACGTPTIHGDYAGGPSLVPKKEWLVPPVCYRLDTPHNCYRPVFNPQAWVETVERVLGEQPNTDFCRASVEHLDWAKLWPGVWRRWFLKGIET